MKVEVPFENMLRSVHDASLEIAAFRSEQLEAIKADTDRLGDLRIHHSLRLQAAGARVEAAEAVIKESIERLRGIAGVLNSDL